MVYYGSGGGKFDRTTAAYQGHFAESDSWGGEPERAAALERRLREAQRPVTFYQYPQTKHWFFEADRPEYAPHAAQLAWQRTVDFIWEQLDPPTP
jgi:carboxymethylenebutenolidase